MHRPPHTRECKSLSRTVLLDLSGGGGRHSGDVYGTVLFLARTSEFFFARQIYWGSQTHPFSITTPPPLFTAGSDKRFPGANDAPRGPVSSVSFYRSIFLYIHTYIHVRIYLYNVFVFFLCSIKINRLHGDIPFRGTR